MMFTVRDFDVCGRRTRSEDRPTVMLSTLNFYSRQRFNYARAEGGGRSLGHSAAFRFLRDLSVRILTSPDDCFVSEYQRFDRANQG